MLYTYCKVFSISPVEAYHTPAELLLEMLTIHAEVEKLKGEEMKKKMNTVK
jgi:hypothetical protein